MIVGVEVNCQPHTHTVRQERWKPRCAMLNGDSVVSGMSSMLKELPSLPAQIFSPVKH
jgi:hypothetical protein